MAEPETIAARIEELLATGRSLAGRRVLVSAGGTREPVDAVRYVGNRSSGRMGVAIAAEAQRRGAEVTLLAANLAVAPPSGVEVIETPTAEEMLREAVARAGADLVVMAAAVADYRPREPLAGKRPKDAAGWSLELEPTGDVIGTLAARRTNGQVLVAFGAESGEQGLGRKRRMLSDKNVDLVVYNDVGRTDIGFDAYDNEVVLITRAGERAVAKAAKSAVAAAVLDAAEQLLEEADGRAGA
jgi:phosphopantothenoylcysteine decarboxylase/phosphopantothenate--cysteine ligase